MEKDFDYSVFIGRFQPAHKAHIEVIRHGLKIADKLIIAIGSANSPPTIKNPFSFQERVEIIKSSLGKEEIDNIFFVPIRDYYYNDNLWCADVQQKVNEIVKDGLVTLIGSYKDSSSYYLNLFPQWEFSPIRQKQEMDATEVRNNLLSPTDAWDGVGSRYLSKGALTWLNNNFVFSEKHLNLIKEFDYINKYKESWKAAPFPPTFVTADAVVTCAGHVLVIERGFNPGKGLFAIPGGFLKQDEKIKDGAIRELKEETRIDLDKRILASSIVDSQVFDFPGRSLRGRVITHAFHLKLNGELPRIREGSDASKVKWMSIADVFKNEDKFFEDHFSIIQHFVLRN